MSTGEVITLAALAALGVFLSAIFSGMETGLYTLNRVRLTVRAARRQGQAVRLRRELVHQNRTLSTLLIGTNAASYLVSYAIARLLHTLAIDDWMLIGIEVIAVTPVLFVFAETLPKDLFRRHADNWMYPLSGVLVASKWAFRLVGLLPIVQLVGLLVARLLGSDPRDAVTARQRISQLLKEGVGTGVLTESQTMLADRALAMRSRTIETEMIPWNRVATLHRDAERPQRETLIRRRNFTRMPVVDDTGTPVGILSSLDALLEPDRPTAELMIDLLSFDGGTPVRDALRSMRESRRKMAVVVTPDGRPRGLVTLKDLVEPVTGELAAW